MDNEQISRIVFHNNIFVYYIIMKLLELFSGTGSIGRVAKERGYELVSLDLKNADINCDVLEWNFKYIQWGILISSGVALHAQNTA